MQKGCACSFLFGPETTDDQKKQIEQSLETKSELKLEVTFYRSNGKHDIIKYHRQDHFDFYMTSNLSS
jgi:hypothetical protein